MVRTQGPAFTAGAFFLCAAASAQLTGPSSSQSPYVLPYYPQSGVVTTSILTVGDSIGGYRMIGLPDGLGAMGNGDGTFTLFMNHEIGTSSGVIRAHGSRGAFVSRWTINAPTLQVTSGRDHNQSAADVHTNPAGGGWVASGTTYGRFCSADLAGAGAYRFGALGTDARLYLNGEEVGAEGRAFAHVVTGLDTNRSYELPRLGNFSWENAVANPMPQAKTIVAGLDDSSSQGQVYFYVGAKAGAGNEAERAGLNNGSLYGIKVQGLTSETRPSVPAPGTRFEMFNHGNVSALTGAQLNQSSASNGVTNWLRPEDGVWDTRPGHENSFYFVTTDTLSASGGRSRLWRLDFDDIANPETGGTLTNLMAGTEGQNMFDNITMDATGRLLIQEDPGGTSLLAKVWAFDVTTGKYGIVAQHDPGRFTSGAPNFLTINEESSGIIDASDLLGRGWFLFDVMAHYSNGAELVEGGQLLAMYLPDGYVPAPGAVLTLAGAGLLCGRRRRASLRVPSG